HPGRGFERCRIVFEVDIDRVEAAIIAIFGERSWLTPMHSTSSLFLSIRLARFSPIGVGIAVSPDWLPVSGGREHPALRRPAQLPYSAGIPAEVGDWATPRASRQSILPMSDGHCSGSRPSREPA